MAIDLASVMQSGLGLAFDSATRLYRIQGEGEIDQLLVEAWSLEEQLDRPFTLDLYALSLDARIDIQALLGQTVTLQIALADGSLQPRSGIVFKAAAEESDGGFARYRLTLRPWTQLLAHTRQSRVWQDKTTIEIVEDVFSRYAAHAQWRWADDVAAHLAQSPFAGSEHKRSYTVQYRETDLAFVTRLLAEEGLGARIEQDSDDEDGAGDGGSEQASSGSSAKPPSPCHHSLVIFAFSPSQASCPEDATSACGDGIRFHRESAVETSDAVQAFGGLRTLQAASTTVLAWDYASKRSIAASVPTHHEFGGANAPRLESYRPARAHAYSSATQAQRAATLGQEAIEVRNKKWLGRSTVRTLQPGHSFTLIDSPLDDFFSLGSSGLGSTSSSSSNEDQTRFLVTAVTHAGINNLPKDVGEAIAGRFDCAGVGLLAPWVDAEVRAQAIKTGYGNAFEATRAYVPWRPEPIARPKAPRSLIAEVVGADGGSAEEIHTDRLGRIKIRHDFQKPGEASTWVRVLQPFAGSNHGLQFIPRVGQHALIDFFDDDLERPFCRAALYTGKGQGGVAPTTGGKAGSADTSSFGQSTDHTPSAQGNTAGGNAPPWHAASPDAISAGGQMNAGAMSGWKTKEFDGVGFNQLVFDDSNGQLRTQLASTQYASQLNLGHLIHQADNHRGSFRGLGFELRTDGYGTLRGGRGLVLSTFGITPAAPSGDNAAGIAIAAQLKTLVESFSQAAKTHETVALAGAIGTTKANQCALSDTQASVSAMHTALKGMVAATSFDEATADASEKKTQTGEGKVPQLTDPVVAISARAGLAVTAGQDVAMLAGEGLVMAARQDPWPQAERPESTAARPSASSAAPSPRAAKRQAPASRSSPARATSTSKPRPTPCRSRPRKTC